MFNLYCTLQITTKLIYFTTNNTSLTSLFIYTTTSKNKNKKNLLFSTHKNMI